MYTPAVGEPDFTFYVAIFGMRNDTVCERWGDGWGRRLGDGHTGYGHDDHDDDDGPYVRDPYGMAPARISAEGTLWVMDSNNIPGRVTGPRHGHSRSLALLSDGDFDYHDHPNTLAFIAPPENDLPNKFEAFSPTLFKPRGSCIADYPMRGEYRIAVWGDAAQSRKHKFSIGIGLAGGVLPRLPAPPLLRSHLGCIPAHHPSSGSLAL